MNEKKIKNKNTRNVPIQIHLQYFKIFDSFLE